MSSDSIEAAFDAGEGSSRQHQREDVQHFGIVTDGQADIAKSQLLERIIVGVAGRQRLQKIYVRKSSAGGKTTASYKPLDDAPSADKTVSILSTKEEIESRAETIEFLVQYWNAQATAIREQHGGVTYHASINDLMIKIGNCVDKTALRCLEEQVFAIHAEQLATANSNGVGYIEACIALIDEALAIST